MGPSLPGRRGMPGSSPWPSAAGAAGGPVCRSGGVSLQEQAGRAASEEEEAENDYQGADASLE